MRFPNRSDTDQTVQSQKQARSLEFRIYEEEEVSLGCTTRVAVTAKLICAFFSQMKIVDVLMRWLICCLFRLPIFFCLAISLQPAIASWKEYQKLNNNSETKQYL